jgi:surface protein
MFSYCGKLTSLDLSSFDTSNVTNMSSMFSNCYTLTRVDGYISFKSYSSSTMSSSYMFSSNSTLRKITFKDIGYNSNAKQFNMSYVSNWGVNNDAITDARQSLIDSLITYSYDRASNGYSTCTVTLASNTKAVLTEDEIAQITAKGFTIA